MSAAKLRTFHVAAPRDDGTWRPDGEVLGWNLGDAGAIVADTRGCKRVFWIWPARGVLEGRSGRGAFRVVDPLAANPADLPKA